MAGQFNPSVGAVSNRDNSGNCPKSSGVVIMATQNEKYIPPHPPLIKGEERGIFCPQLPICLCQFSLFQSPFFPLWKRGKKGDLPPNCQDLS